MKKRLKHSIVCCLLFVITLTGCGERDSFHLLYDGYDTGVEILFKDCVCEYDKDDIQLYSHFVKAADLETEGYVLYIQSSDDTLTIFPIKDFLVDRANDSIYMLWGISNFERVQGIDFVENISGFKMLSIDSLESLICEVHGLELLENQKNFEDLQVEFIGLKKKDGNTVLCGNASGIFLTSGNRYFIEWEINTDTLTESAK